MRSMPVSFSNSVSSRDVFPHLPHQFFGVCELPSCPLFSRGQGFFGLGLGNPLAGFFAIEASGPHCWHLRYQTCFYFHVWSVMAYIIKLYWIPEIPCHWSHTRVSHNQGYHLVCTWGQKWKFIYGPKNNWTWKSIDYSVWNQNIAELSLIFIEL